MKKKPKLKPKFPQQLEDGKVRMLAYAEANKERFEKMVRVFGGVI